MRFLVSLGALLILAGGASAQCGTFRGPYVSRYVAPVKKVIVEEVVPVVAVFAAVPVVSIGYAPAPAVAPTVQAAPAAGTAPGGFSADEVAALRRLLAGGGAQPAAGEASAEPRRREEGAHVAILRSACLSCHDGAAAKGGVRLFDRGVYVKPDPATVKAVLSAAKSNRMPKGKPPLSDEQFSALLSILDE